MGRKHVTAQFPVIRATARNTTIVGTVTECEQLDELRYYLSWSSGSSLNAAISFDVSEDLDTWEPIDINALATPLTGTSGATTLVMIHINFKYIRPTITFSAGSANLLLKVKGKTIAA